LATGGGSPAETGLQEVFRKLPNVVLLTVIGVFVLASSAHSARVRL
jgi:hypothetical protein